MLFPIPRPTLAALASIVVCLAAGPAISQMPTRNTSAGPPNPVKTLVNEAIELRGSQRYKESVERYENALKLAPNEPVILNNLAVVYSLMGRNKDAEELLLRSVRIAPSNPTTNLNLSIVYQSLKRPYDSLNFANKAFAAAPERTEILAKICELHLEIRENLQSADCYEKLLNIDRRNFAHFVNYSIVLNSLQRFKRSKEVLVEAQKSFPQEAVVYNGLGVLFYNERNYKEAIASFRRGIAINPDEAAMRYNLGVAELAAKNRGGAIEQYAYLKNSNSGLAGDLFKLIYAGKVVKVMK